MALRRLFSGWLIAMAALARSVAQALERASEDRSAPAPDPVMAALAERYPGAPAHWLAHVAERTSQLAETGQAPLSLNSDPTAWPPAGAPVGAPVGADGPPLRPLTPEASPAPKAREPIARDPGVPSLADLRDRSGEVWRRSEPERRRRPRPVFAATNVAPAYERVVRPTATPELTRRPRSPLSLVEPSRTTPERLSPVATADPEAPAARSIVSSHETVWSQAPVSRTATPEPTRELAKAGPGRPTEPPSVDRMAALPGSEIRRHDRPEAFTDDVAARRGVPRRKSWFFAKSASASLGRPLALSTVPGPPVEDPSDAPEPVVADAAPKPRPAFPFLASDRRTAAPKRVWRARPSPPARHAVFRALTALRAKPHPRAEHPAASEPAVAPTTPPIDPPSSTPRPRPPAPSFKSSAIKPQGRAAPDFPLREPSVERDAPPSRGEDRDVHRAVARASRQVSNATPADPPHDRRPVYAGPRPSSSRAASRPFADLPSDDRWPALPPPTFAAPTGVEAPQPRWDQLAREQEEGRWSV